MNLDRAIEAAAGALKAERYKMPNNWDMCEACDERDARIAVEAAAPHIYEAHLDYRERAALERAERAEAEVERLREFIAGKVDRYAEDGESFLPRGWTLVDGGRLDELEAAEERAERAEATLHNLSIRHREVWELADRLAEALRNSKTQPWTTSGADAALAAYEEARHGT